jgi:hypothetical protein
LAFTAATAQADAVHETDRPSRAALAEHVPKQWLGEQRRYTLILDGFAARFEAFASAPAWGLTVLAIAARS